MQANSYKGDNVCPFFRRQYRLLLERQASAQVATQPDSQMYYPRLILLWERYLAF
jgi:hypothetical protein